MKSNNIELELRAKVSNQNYTSLLNQLQKKEKLTSHTKRLSVMYFGEVNNKTFDIRVRITNGESEVVIKKGELHTEDRTEISNPINKSQFIKMTELFNLFEFRAEVGERETYNFDMGDNIVFSLVSSGELAYVEVEKMTNTKNLETNREKLLHILSKYNLRPITTQSEFDSLCQQLSENSDWSFQGKEEDYNKLEKLLATY